MGFSKSTAPVFAKRPGLKSSPNLSIESSDKALVTRSDALVPSSVLVTTSKAPVTAPFILRTGNRHHGGEVGRRFAAGIALVSDGAHGLQPTSNGL